MNPATTRRQFLASTAALGGLSAFGGNLLAAADIRGGGGSASAVPLAPPDKQPAKLELPRVPARKIGWAIVGLGQLAVEEILPAFAKCQLAECRALVSGHPEKARQLATKYGVAADAIYDYQTFDRLGQDPRVDVIYIVLPNSMHAEYTVRGLKAGRHVLCEKPMAVTVPECEQMLAAAKESGKQLGIAYRLHYEPLNMKAAELCQRKAFGKPKIFSATNAQNTQAPNIRLSKELGGGPVGDVGVYCINAARYCLGEEPVEVSAFAHQPTDDPRFREVPESVVFTLRYPSGVVAHCDCSFGTTEARRFQVLCEKGYVEMDPAFSYRGLKLFTKQGEAQKGTGERAELQIPQVDHFAAEMDGFSQAILDGKPTKTPGEMGLADMRIVTAIAESIKTGRPVKLTA